MTVQSAPAPAPPAFLRFWLFTGDFVGAMFAPAQLDLSARPTIRIRGGYPSAGRLKISVFVDWTPGSISRTTEYSTRNVGNLHIKYMIGAALWKHGRGSICARYNALLLDGGLELLVRKVLAQAFVRGTGMGF